MTASPGPPLITTATRLGPEDTRHVERICAAEEQSSGQRPLGEPTRGYLSRPPAEWPGRHWLLHRDRILSAYAHEDAGTPPAVGLTADPSDADASVALLAALVAHVPSGILWAHGDRSQARAAAAGLGLAGVRDLLLMTRALARRPDVSPAPAGIRLRDFDRDRDADRWVKLNAAVFSQLPDQGSLTRADLDERLAADWFDPRDFIVAETTARPGALAGFHWTKLDPDAIICGEPSGEVYVIGVADRYRGTGLALALMTAGLAHLFDKGLRRVHLYVDSGNPVAIRLYERLGFTVWDTDRMYSW